MTAPCGLRRRPISAPGLSCQTLWHSELALRGSLGGVGGDAHRRLELWRKAGDPRRESQSMREVSKAMWRLCRGPEWLQASEAALALAEPLGPSPELARAYEGIGLVRRGPRDGRAVRAH